MTIGAPNPYKVQSQQQDLTKGGLDIENSRLTLEGKKLDLEKTRLDMEKGDREQKAAEGAKNAAGFYRRALNAHQGYGEGVAPRAPIVEDVVDMLPDSIERKLSSNERRSADTYAAEFIAATLRKESGAAISPQEFESQFARYFPQAGDGPDQIAIKKQLREQAIQAIRDQAGDLVTDPGFDGAQAKPRLSDEDFQAQLRKLVQSGDREAIGAFLLEQGGKVDPSQLNDALKAGDARISVEQQGAGHDFGVGVGGVLQGVGDVANLVSSPFISAVNAVTGSNYNPDMGESLRDLVGTPDPQTGAENTAFSINRFGTGALNLAGAARGAGRYIAQELPNVGNAMLRFGSAPLTDAFAGSTGGAASEQARQAGGGPVSQAVAGIAGSALSLPAASRFNALMAPRGPVSTQLTRAGAEEGVTVNRAMADPSAQQRVTAVGKTMVGGKKMQRDMREVGGQIERGVQRLGGDGTPMDENVAGQTVRNVGERFIKQSGQKLGKRYDALEAEVGGIKVAPKTSLARVDEAIARLGETGETNKAEISFLEGLKKDLGKDLSVGALRRLRTKLRKKISKGELTFGDDEATVLSIMDTAADDIAAGLQAAGKGGAAAKFKALDTEYRDRMDFIKGTVQKLIGNRNSTLNPRQVFDNFRGMASPKGNDAGLARMMREMSPEEQSDMAATFADALGKNGDGEFSTAFLVKQAEKLPKAARVNIFGQEGARSIENLVTLAKEHKRVSHALGGSPTAVGNDYRSYLINLVLGGGAAGVTGSGAQGLAVAAGGLAVKSGRDLLNARALMSPSIQKWLRTAPRTTDPKAINTHFDRLKAIAAREPALGEEIKQLQQAIMKAANENVTPSAAASQSENRN